MRPKYLIVARVHRPHGLGGEVEASSLTDFPERFKRGAKLYPSPPIIGLEYLIIEKVGQTPQGLLLKFEGIDSRSEAERVTGRNLMVPEEEAAELPEGEFWVHDIIGMEVYTTSGEFLGFVEDVLRTGSNDVYIVKDTKEFLIPATKEVVKDISIKNRKITIEPIPGLLE
ncbi:MAG TPA: ribosome maturation factor RimM [Anaerolineae bacterium]|jgi:16S rRNA processing protein RimM|nr:ribosome maturation factor RimM [Anaerolineae bacterium]